MRDTTRTILTVATVATMMALLLPISAQAAGQLMTIVDANSDAKAQVEDGRLRVGDGKGALTVNGAVASRPALPADPFSIADTTNTVAVVSLGRGRIAITDLVVSQANDSSTPVRFLVSLYRGRNGDCSTIDHIRSVLAGYVPADETLAIQLSTPVVANGRPVCLRIQAGELGDIPFYSYTVTGYRT